MPENPGNYLPALQDARKKFAARPEPERLAECSGAVFDPEHCLFMITYCNRNYLIEYPRGNVRFAQGSQKVPASDQIILLLYLAGALPVPVRKQWSTFLELPGGPHHYALFLKEAVQPLVDTFGSDLSSFQERGKLLGGTESAMGDAGLVIPALPRIPLAYSLWEGDDEFSPWAAILFDRSAPMHLDTASLYVLGINTTRKFLKDAGGC